MKATCAHCGACFPCIKAENGAEDDHPENADVVQCCECARLSVPDGASGYRKAVGADLADMDDHTFAAMCESALVILMRRRHERATH